MLVWIIFEGNFAPLWINVHLGGPINYLVLYYAYVIKDPFESFFILVLLMDYQPDESEHLMHESQSETL